MAKSFFNFLPQPTTNATYGVIGDGFTFVDWSSSLQQQLVENWYRYCSLALEKIAQAENSNMLLIVQDPFIFADTR